MSTLSQKTEAFEAYATTDKWLIHARAWLLGMAQHDFVYFKVLDALEFAKQHHTGTRNDGAPEFMHQLGIFRTVSTLHSQIVNPATVYMLIFMHDCVEDPHQETKKFVAPDDIRHNFGEMIERKVLMLSKEILGQKNDDYSLSKIFEDQDTSVVKLGDRENNISTMVGPFKRHRLERYVKETRESFIPGAHAARRKFPSQIGVYNNLQFSIENQLRLVGKILEGYTPNE